MDVLFMDSFSNYNTPAMAALSKWQTYYTNGALLSMMPGAGPTGAQALSMTGAASGLGTYMQGVLPSNLARLILGVRINVTHFDVAQECPFLQFLDPSAGQVCVSFTPSGFIAFRSGVGGGTLLAISNTSVLVATNVYYFLEFDITFNGTTGTIALTTNNVNVPLSVSSGLNTAPTGNNYISAYRLGQPTSNNGGTQLSSSNAYFADFRIVGGATGAYTGPLGDAEVVLMLTNGPGAVTQLMPSGAATDWECVKEVFEDADATYAFSPVVGAKDLYEHQASPTNSGRIFAVQACAVGRKDATGGLGIQNTVKSGSTTADGAATALSETYAWFLKVWSTDPNTGGEWVKTGLDAAQFGVKVSG
jgi:hypothetical protein